MVPNVFGKVSSEYKPREGETQRDCHRRVLVKMMHEKIGMQYWSYRNYVLILWLAPFSPDNVLESSIFQWKRFLDTAFKLHIRVVNWDPDIFPIGPGFDLRTITPAQLKALTKARIEKELDGDTNDVEFEIVAWSQGQHWVAI